MNDPLLVVLAGGVSSRMKRPGSVTLDLHTIKDAEEKSKSMIGIDKAGRPFLDYLLFNAESAGYRDVVLVIGEGDRTFRSYYGNADAGNRFHRLEISYAIQNIPHGRTKPLGTANALLQALRAKPGWKHRAFTMCNSDNLYSTNSFRTMLEAGHQCAMIAYDLASLGLDPSRAKQFAVVKATPDGFLEEIIEKPSDTEIARITEFQGGVGVSMNLFRFAYDSILPFLETVPADPIRHEKELPTAVMLMIKSPGSTVRVFNASEEVPDLTNRDDISRVRAFIERAYPGFSWS